MEFSVSWDEDLQTQKTIQRTGEFDSYWNGKQKIQGDDKSFGEMMDERGIIIGN